MRGQSYVGRKKKETELKDAKVMGPPCLSPAYKRAKKVECNEVPESKRKEIFQYFWKKLDWKERRIYVQSLVEVTDVKRRRAETEEDGPRKNASTFCHLVVDGRRTRVCQTMFLSTLGISQWNLLKWVGRRDKSPQQTPQHSPQQSPQRPEKAKKTKRVRVRSEAKDYLKTYLQDLPRVPSHYCRSTTSKLYVESSMFRSVSHLHRLYKRSCRDNDVRHLSRQVFTKMFNDMNLALFKPKKDQCDTCAMNKSGNLGAAEYEEHFQKKVTARAAKDHDKAHADVKTMVTCMDLQGLLLSPKLQASALYYKTKLAVHNFTIYNMRTKNATNYLWHEGEAGISANEFASCIVNYLEENKGYNEFILWSDGCGYQNRNLLLSNALLKFATEKKKRVTQKYLERGHTQMECDSVHSTIEGRLRNRDIHVPAEYAAVIKGARIKPPYEVS